MMKYYSTSVIQGNFMLMLRFIISLVSWPNTVTALDYT